MKIKTKLIVGFGLITILLIAAQMLGYRHLKEIQTKSTINVESEQLIVIANSLISNIEDIRKKNNILFVKSEQGETSSNQGILLNMNRENLSVLKRELPNLELIQLIESGMLTNQLKTVLIQSSLIADLELEHSKLSQGADSSFVGLTDTLDNFIYNAEPMVKEPLDTLSSQIENKLTVLSAMDGLYKLFKTINNANFSDNERQVVFREIESYKNNLVHIVDIGENLITAKGVDLALDLSRQSDILIKSVDRIIESFDTQGGKLVSVDVDAFNSVINILRSINLNQERNYSELSKNKAVFDGCLSDLNALVQSGGRFKEERAIILKVVSSVEDGAERQIYNINKDKTDGHYTGIKKQFGFAQETYLGYVKDMKKQVNEVTEVTSEVSELLKNENILGYSDEMIKALTDYESIRSDFHESIVNKIEAYRKYDLTHTLLEETLGLIEGNISKIKDHSRALVANRVKEIESEVKISRNEMLIVTIVAALISLILAWWVQNYISKSLDSASLTLKAVAKGNLDLKIGGTKNDEIGSLLRAMKEMVEDLTIADGVLKKVASGDLRDSKDINNRGLMLLTVNKMSRDLRDIVVDVNKSAQMMEDGGKDLNDACQLVAKNNESQAASAEECAAAIEEMNASIHENSDNANTTNNIAEKVLHKAEQSRIAVKSSTDSMKEIASKVKIIEEFARRTDLLALNAAVEAARAGTHGRGFAIVAKEVRSLAEKCANSAKDILTATNQGVERANIAADNLENLLPEVQKTTDLVGQISVASSEQATNAGQLSQSIHDLDQVISGNTVAANNMTQMARTFSTQASDLKKAIDFFTINNEDFSSANEIDKLDGKILNGSVNCKEGFDLKMDEKIDRPNLSEKVNNSTSLGDGSNSGREHNEFEPWPDNKSSSGGSLN